MLLRQGSTQKVNAGRSIHDMPYNFERGLGNFDSLGLNHSPQRVVSLVPSVTETLFEFGLGDRLVGVTDYCVLPAEAQQKPKMGGTKNPDLARIQAALPDLILANQEENRKEDVEALRAAGLKVWVTFPCTVQEAVDGLSALIRLFRVPRFGQQLAMLEKSLEWASLAAENAVPVRVFCPIWREPTAAEGRPRWWMTINDDTYVHDLLRVCGGENIFAGRQRHYPLAADLDAGPGQETGASAGGGAARDTRYPRVTPEEVAALAPEVILLPSEPYPFTEADLTAFEAFPDLPALQNNRIHLVDGSLLTWHGIRVARALAELPALLAPPTQDDWQPGADATSLN
jgi:ABC-type Fe3+-hydroxamate transport system substrate-binding protein